MVFSSIPLYLDPHNWHQQQNHQHEDGGTGNHQVSVLPPPPPQIGGGGAGSIRPGSMADRARLAKLPQPEPGLKCPRCESTNTKFCYFNNYSLTQPRHFCKACRRYWTRGGALRSVPVGGGCRRNKRSSKNSNNSTTTSKSCQVTSTTPSSCSTEVMPTHFPQLPLMPSLENLGSSTQFGAANLGLNFGGIQPESDLGFIQLGSSYNNNNNNNNNSSSEKNSSILSDQWRNSQHFPFLTSFEPAAASTSFYQLFQSDQNVVEAAAAPPSNNPLVVGQNMKMEDHHQNHPLGLNLTKPLLLGGGGSENINQYNWGNGGNAWTDFSGGGLNSSSPASHLL